MEMTTSYKFDHKVIEDLPKPCNVSHEYFNASAMGRCSPEMMRNEVLRFATLRMFPRGNRPDIVSIAVAGFYSSSDFDAVSCYCCGLTLRGLTANDNPLEIHKLHSNECPFIKQNRKVNEPFFEHKSTEKEILQSAPNVKEPATEAECLLGADISNTGEISKNGSDQIPDPPIVAIGKYRKARQADVSERNDGKTYFPHRESFQQIHKKSQEHSQMDECGRKDNITEWLENDCGTCHGLETHTESEVTDCLMYGDFVELHDTQSNYTCKEPPRLHNKIEIGRGAFGKCYLGYNRTSRSFQALKEIKSELASVNDPDKIRENAWKELSLAKTLCHPNIIRTFAGILDTHTVGICMEYMPGGTVAGLLRDYGKGLEESLIKSYAQQLLYGLSYLHLRQILHRDIKGDNLLLDGDERKLKIGDFGSATEVDDSTRGVTARQLVGTVPFMAPEVARYQQYSGASDIWSVGCCIVEMATGKMPWTAENYSDFNLIFKIGSLCDTHDVPDELTSTLERLSSPLKNLALSCLAIKPNLRPSADELIKSEVFDKIEQEPCGGYCFSLNAFESC